MRVEVTLRTEVAGLVTEKTVAVDFGDVFDATIGYSKVAHELLVMLEQEAAKIQWR